MRSFWLRPILFLALCGATAASAQVSVEAPRLVLRGVPFDLKIGAQGADISLVSGDLTLVHGDIRQKNGATVVSDVIIPELGNRTVEVSIDGQAGHVTVYSLPGVVSILPPLVTIVLALLTKQIMLSLFSGIWLGTIFTLGGSLNPVIGFLRTLDTYLLGALTNVDHMSIALLILILGGMVGILSRSGGTQGIVMAMARRADTRRMGMVGTWLLGMVIFFDDYSNSLLVGNTMRPFTDKLKISREKLSYLVDSTSAPIASIALVSTWIGFELGLINSSFQNMGVDQSAYAIFLAALPYNFYSFITLALVLIIAMSGRDFGPMLKAERRSVREGKVLRDGAKPLLDEELSNMLPPDGVVGHWYTAILPIVTLVIVMAVGLYVEGMNTLGAGNYPLREIIGAANTFVVFIWAAAAGAVVAGVLAVGSRILSVEQTVDAFMVGLKAMVVGVIILTLARGLQMISGDLHTADYIFHLTADILDPRFLPALTFIIAALISFSTGTSYGTMAILVPVVVPLAYYLPEVVSIDSPILLGSIGAVLSGAIFGDHCSPISDTTILSSIASGADHIDHVRTQLPYGLTVAGITLLVGYMPAGFGFSPIMGNILALAILGGVVWKFGRPAD